MTMRPDSPQWKWFLSRLEKACSFHRWDLDSLPDCDGTPDRPKTRALLGEMGLSEEEIAATMGFFSDHLGRCDCGVILNVERIFKSEVERGIMVKREKSSREVVARLLTNDPQMTQEIVDAAALDYSTVRANLMLGEAEGWAYRLMEEKWVRGNENGGMNPETTIPYEGWEPGSVSWPKKREVQSPSGAVLPPSPSR